MVTGAERKYQIVGYLLLILGGGLVLFSPLEIYCYYLFSDGGRFYYEGFQFGSFMFGNITGQILVYFSAGIILISLGYGHILLRSWVRRFTIALVYVWLIFGIPLILLILFILAASKNPTIIVFYIIVVFLVLSYILIPFIVIRHYRRTNTIRILSTHSKINWIDNLPISLFISILIYFIFAAISFLLMFFNGIFPLFGVFKTSISGILLLDINCLVLGLLTFGTVKRKRLTWWLSIVYFCALGISSAITFIGSTYEQILYTLSFPPKEIDWLKGIPLKNYHFLILSLSPVIIGLVNDVLSKKYYQSIDLQKNEDKISE
jgi:hypothetical protein